MLSIIKEYSILYSDRINQRDKKWVDGKLKYYEINNKLEIVSLDGDLIKTDFKPLKFEIDKQYIIGKFIIEIIELEHSYEREITIKKETKTHVSIKAGPRTVKREMVEEKVEAKKRLVARNQPLRHIIKGRETPSTSSALGNIPKPIEKEVSSIQPIENVQHVQSIHSKPMGDVQHVQTPIIKTEKAIQRPIKPLVTIEKPIHKPIHKPERVIHKPEIVIQKPEKVIHKPTAEKVVQKPSPNKLLGPTVLGSTRVGLTRPKSSKTLSLKFKIIKPIIKRIPRESTNLYRS